MGIIMRYNSDGSGQRAEDGKEQAPDHVRDAQRHHGLRQQCRDKEDDADEGKHVGKRNVGKHDL